MIGKTLKKLRKANNLTTEQIAAYLGITSQEYVAVEDDIAEPTLEFIEKAAMLLGCEEYTFFDNEGNVTGKSLVTPFPSDATTSDLRQVASFKNIILNYEEMETIETKYK